MGISIFASTVIKHATPQIPHFVFGRCKQFAYKVVHSCTSVDEFLIITIQTFNAVCCITAERDTVPSFETGPLGTASFPSNTSTIGREISVYDAYLCLRSQVHQSAAPPLELSLCFCMQAFLKVLRSQMGILQRHEVHGSGLEVF